jgi:hypothetical protein
MLIPSEKKKFEKKRRVKYLPVFGSSVLEIRLCDLFDIINAFNSADKFVKS